MVNLEIIRKQRIVLPNIWIANFFSKRLKTRKNLEPKIYSKRDAELWTVYNKFEVWSISDTPALKRFFLVFFLLVVLSVAKDRKYSVFQGVKLFFPDRHFLVKYGICFHRAISPLINDLINIVGKAEIEHVVRQWTQLLRKIVGIELIARWNRITKDVLFNVLVILDLMYDELVVLDFVWRAQMAVLIRNKYWSGTTININIWAQACHVR